MAKYATTADGAPLYLRTSTSWGRSTENLVEAPTLREAKAAFGWTRAQHTTITIRRATPEDVDRIPSSRPVERVS